MSTSQPDSARARSVEFGADSLIVQLDDGRSLHVPLEWFPRLRDASAADRANWRLIGRGVGIRWEALDEDVSVHALLEPQQARTTDDAPGHSLAP